MKLIFALFAFVSFQALAAPSAAQLLEGKYELVHASKYGRTLHCPDELMISVDENALRVHPLRGVGLGSTFWAKDEACLRERTDDDGSYSTCTNFARFSATQTFRAPFTRMGYISEVTRVALSWNKKTLMYSNDLTQFPFGITGAWDDKDFTCVYKRL